MTKTIDKIAESTLKLLETLEVNDYKIPFKIEQASNVFTDKPYTGINTLLLPFTTQGLTQKFATFKQFADKGYKIKKGEKASDVYFYSNYTKDNDDDKPIWFLKIYKVFSIDQVEGGEELLESKNRETKKIPSIESYVKKTNAIINIGNKACYNPVSDSITMPKQSTFIDDLSYYQVLLHELSHWTGHKSRLDRDFKGKAELSSYAQEELIAELSSMILCSKFNIEKKLINDSAYYFQNWKQAIKTNAYNASFILNKASKVVKFLDEMQQDSQAAKAA